MWTWPVIRDAFADLQTHQVVESFDATDAVVAQVELFEVGEAVEALDHRDAVTLQRTVRRAGGVRFGCDVCV